MQNESTLDRVIRAVLGGGSLAGGLLADAWWRWLLFGAGAVLLYTAATGVCLLYKPFGIDTRHADTT